MQWPKVSVLVPAFNEEKYIERALTALLRQDYPCFEIIVSDNASTDRTAAVVRRVIEHNTRPDIQVILLHENRRGTNYARECARQSAAGSVIAQMDADCIPRKDWITKGVKYLLRSQRSAVTGPYDYFDGHWLMRYFSLVSQRLLYPVTNILVQLSGRAAILIGGNAFIRSEILARAGGYNTSLTFYGDDIDLGTRLSRYGKVAYINTLVQPTSSRRYRANGFWKVNKKYQACFWNLVWQKKLLTAGMETNHPR